MDKYKLATFISATSFILMLAFFLFTPGINLLRINSDVGMSFTVGSIHSTITITKGDEVVLREYHAGALTTLGMNFTLGNIVKNSTGTGSYNSTWLGANYNLSFVSIGNAYATWACNNTEVLLPGEWNRTLGTQHDMTYNTFNVTATFYPDTGPYTADCIGLNFEGGIGNDAQWGYDTFTEVTGIDDTFTITVEIKVTLS